MNRMAVCRVAGVGVFAALLLPAVSEANERGELETLKRKVDQQDAVVQRQQATVQQLMDQLAQLAAKVDVRPAPPPATQARVNLEGAELASLPAELVQTGGGPLPVHIGGYIDVGYVDPSGSGTVSTSALQVTSRGDTLSSLGLDGDSSLLVNELNVDLRATPTPRAEAVANLAFLPRKLTITSSGGSAFTDAFEVNLAYLAYAPFPQEAGPLIDNLFGDMKLSVGKFESPMGIEYRDNKASDRVNISRSMMSIYWTGYPIGIKARGTLFKRALNEFRHSIVTYNLALTNTEPWVTNVVDGDRATNSRRTVMGRLAYGLELFPGAFFETGTSLAYGARINQGDNHTLADSIDVDGRLEWGPLTLRAEYDFSDLDRPRSGGSSATAAKFSHLYLEGYCEWRRPHWVPTWVPLVSLTPYYRYDTRNLNSFPAVGVATTLTQVQRHTLALRYLMAPGRMLKTEYQLVGEAEGAAVDAIAFLMSFVQQF